MFQSVKAIFPMGIERKMKIEMFEYGRQNSNKSKMISVFRFLYLFYGTQRVSVYVLMQIIS